MLSSSAIADAQVVVDGVVDDLKLAHVLVDTTIASDGRSTTSCRLTAGADDDYAYIGARVVLMGGAGASFSSIPLIPAASIAACAR